VFGIEEIDRSPRPWISSYRNLPLSGVQTKNPAILETPFATQRRRR
jgi:hypothetical protein